METKGKMMSLDEAIQHCLEVYKENLRICEMAQDVGIENDHYKQCGLEHLQLAEWLKELKSRRKVMDKVKKGIKSMKLKQNCANRDYYTGFVSALSTVEGYIAICEEVEVPSMACEED